MNDPTPIASVIGAAAKQHRTQHGATLDEVAREAKRLGLRWSESRVGDFERGKVAPALGTLIAAAAAYGMATGTALSLALLVDAGPEMIEVTPALALSGSRLVEMFEGVPVTMTAGDIYSSDEIRKATESGLTTLSEVAERFPGLSLSDLDAASRTTTGVTSDRIARELGQPWTTVGAISIALWGRTFERERDRRAGLNASPQKRGHVTRQLKAELRTAIEAAANGNN